MGEEQALIPGLPEDLAMDCLSRIPYRSLIQIRPVCRKWRDLAASPAFLRHRQRVGAAEDLVFLVQALKEDAPPAGESTNAGGDGEGKDQAAAAANSKPPVYVLSLYNATWDEWHRIATPEPIPMFSQCAAVGDRLVLAGGWDPATLEPVAETRVLDLKTMGWRRGAPMAEARSFFACAAAGGRVYAAGGHDGQKNALRSAEAYDPAADEWAPLPPMSEERDEAKGVNIGGDFWAVSGYSTENQGSFSASAERFDPERGAWERVEGAWDDATCASCFGAGEAAMAVDPSGVREFAGGEWRRVGPAPEGIKAAGAPCGAAIGGGDNRVFVAGGEGSWIVDLRAKKWARLEPPAGFSGFAYSAAAVRI